MENGGSNAEENNKMGTKIGEKLGCRYIYYVVTPLYPPDAVVLSLKRKRIVDRISQGYTRAKRRRFPFSRLNEALGGITIEQIEEQICILETHDIVTLPTRRSVELSRHLNVGAHDYLVNSCGYGNNDIVMLTQANSLLID